MNNATQKMAPEEQKKDFAEKAWLHYFNQTLYEKGLISENARNRMNARIDSRKPRCAK